MKNATPEIAGVALFVVLLQQSDKLRGEAA